MKKQLYSMQFYSMLVYVEQEGDTACDTQPGLFRS